MKLIDVAVAYIAAAELEGQELPYGLAAALCVLKKELQEAAMFYLREEAKLMARYGAQDEKGGIQGANGRFVLKDPAMLKEYEKERTELAQTPAPVRVECRRVAPPERIRPGHLLALEPFLQFEEGNG